MAPGQPTGDRPPAPEGLYVHFPFCVSVCPYCDFVVVAGSSTRGPGQRIDALLGALHQELDLRADVLDAGPALTSVYLGGGTPSLMSAAQLDGLVAHIDRRLGIAAGAEITLEANPGPDELGDLASFCASGVNRVSLGAQSMDDAELKRLGRRHRATDVMAAVESARAVGIGSVSLDLLTDVPRQTLESWRGTLTTVLAMAPDHLSAYTLTLDDPDAEGLTGFEGDHLPVSRGARAWRQRAVAEQDDDRAADMELLTDELASAAGLQRYEIANLARPGHESRHNLLYWRRRAYLALGPGAHASDGAQRRTWNSAHLERYIGGLGGGRLPPGGSEEVDAATEIAERAILGLRLNEGIDAELAADASLAPVLRWAQQQGLAEVVAGRTRLTQRGRLLANEVFMRLLPEQASLAAGSGSNA